MINDFLDILKGKFKIIALSETWMDEERGCDFHIDGYELHHINRVNKKAGGVALFVNSDLKCKPIECMTVAVDDLMECVTVEIEMERSCNIVVTCIYRIPRTMIETFTDAIDDILSKAKGKKTVCTCGDYNIDLLNVSSHKASSDFFEFMYGRVLSTDYQA